MKIERYQPYQKQNNGWLLGCGCLGVFGLSIAGAVFALIFFFPSISETVLDAVGVEALGSTNQVLNAPVPTLPVLMDTQTIGSVTLTTSNYSQTFSGSGEGYSVIIGERDDTLQRQMRINFTEEGLLAQCLQLVTICSSSGEQVRNATFDLRNGGLVIEADLQLPTGQYQQAGLVIRITENNRLDIVGIEIGNQVFAPTSPDFAPIINEAEARGNLFIQALSARAGIDAFTLDSVVIEENSLTVVMQ